MTNSIIVVAGPTASGKTRLGIELAKLYDGEIVSADSMQLYRGMDVGTAKATPAEQARAVHHMIDVADPAESWSVARYVDEAGAVCDEILARGRVPILVGGTGLYIDSLIAGRDFADNQEDRSLRTALEADFDRLGGEAMLRTLAAFDPERAAKLNAGDRRRIVRAIEIYRLTGRTATEHDEETRRRPPRYDAARIVLNFRDRADLYARIDRRVTQMAEDGLFEEVERLLASGIKADCTAMQAIGYKEAVLALRGEITRDEALDLIRQGSRRYAKRQITWFGRWEGAHRILWEREPDFEEGLHSSTAFLQSRGYHE
ncbi:MAG: tRNA (adenosine(37)-N6)-dimethylallyltransferase MiaA [Oscillospiraceae bacterium]|nr:tRNA (adenosine(37)-N6)-dimethylallyltransferase MiaA [Oscillospiraceae bacterium]